MCGIVAASAAREVSGILLNGLKALEYRGYDSAGLALLDGGRLCRLRTAGKVRDLEALFAATPLAGQCGVAHTRWATHGVPSTRNAHPHVSRDKVALVHNGIIENHEELRSELEAAGFTFTSDTDTEVMAHLIEHLLAQGNNLLAAVQHATRRLHGAYAIAVMTVREPGRIVGARRGSPLVLGVGFGEHFLASDIHPLLAVTNRFVFIEEGDIVDFDPSGFRIYDESGEPAERRLHESEISPDAISRGGYRHFMQKEIFEQPAAVSETLEGRLYKGRLLPDLCGAGSSALMARVRNLHLVACGTSFHAGLVARYRIERLARLPCTVEVASEYRYRNAVVPPDTLFVVISQSGETADTLAALRHAKDAGYLARLAICNVPESSVVREADMVLMTRAGPEIGVASTKAFTTQLTALLLLVQELSRHHHGDDPEVQDHLKALALLPEQLRRALELNEAIAEVAHDLEECRSALYIGRGSHYPIALEGALKLKEISYIHAEAFPAGELKHGPLALVDHETPIVAVAPRGHLADKLESNLAEIRARGGRLYVFAAGGLKRPRGDIASWLEVAVPDPWLSPVVMTVPLQLLAYHVAVHKGTDVDQPRNLAKSVTVE